MFLLCAFLSGVIVFLFGISLISKGLELVASDFLTKSIAILASNKYTGLLYGAIITTIVQSSSLITVLLISLVKSRYMTVKQALWVLLGANIGTTMTNQLLTVDMHLCIPLLFIVGFLLLLWKQDERIYVGQILIGIALLFVAMDIMEYAMLPLQDSTQIQGLIISLQNPLVGFCFGVLFTALIQSSSASIAILQTVVKVQMIPLNMIAWIIYGQNIGTCFTGLLASITTSKEGRQVMVVQFLINIVGIFLFIPFVCFYDVLGFIASTSSNTSVQIANLHTFYNILTSILLLPLDNVLVFVSKKMIH